MLFLTESNFKKYFLDVSNVFSDNYKVNDYISEISQHSYMDSYVHTTCLTFDVH